MDDDIEILKKDLIFQLSFEDVDWTYLNETVERAIAADSNWQDLLIDTSSEITNHTLSKNIERVFSLNEKDKKALEAYTHTINRIDDWFEYANESKKDREFIHQHLDALAKRLQKIYKKELSNE